MATASLARTMLPAVPTGRVCRQGAPSSTVACLGKILRHIAMPRATTPLLSRGPLPNRSRRTVPVVTRAAAASTSVGLKQSSPTTAAVIGEFVGTALFTLFGTAAVAQYAAWTNGLALAVFVYVFATISGGHLNPAVSAAIWVTGNITFARFLAYSVAQIVGACVGIAMQSWLVPGLQLFNGKVMPGIAQLGGGITATQGFGWELIMTFVLCLTVLEVAVYDKKWGGLFGPWVVGVSLWVMALVGGGFTGAFLNPARVLGPALMWGNMSYVALFCLAQMCGGVLAGAFVRMFEGDNPAEEPEEGPRDIVVGGEGDSGVF